MQTLYNSVLQSHWEACEQHELIRTLYNMLLLSNAINKIY